MTPEQDTDSIRVIQAQEITRADTQTLLLMVITGLLGAALAIVFALSVI